MSHPIIEVKNISKKYNITHQRGKYIALRDVMANILKNPFSFLKLKAKSVIGLNTKEDFWALRNINFEINKGEIIGIIGHNGAGKSTLLKILSQITPPTDGEIVIRGKVGSLLEVGTGFHPELSGRENIFLNGAILGMRSNEIAEKFDRIVEFAGIEKFLDTPVKYYSSGMYVRLAFSVAAHMEPDILLVDEVLAVGDAEFQKKCLGKMDEITKSEGRTIIFVSHNMSAIQTLCKRTLLLKEGKVLAFGDTREIIDTYLTINQNQEASVVFPEDVTTQAQILSLKLKDAKDSLRTEFSISETFSIETKLKVNVPLRNTVLSLLIYSEDGNLLLYSSESDQSGVLSDYEIGIFVTTITIPKFLLNVGHYTFDIMLHTPNISTHANIKNFGFEIKNTDNPRSVIFQKNHSGKISSILNYKIKKN